MISTSSITPDILEALQIQSVPEHEAGCYICGMIRAEGLCVTDFDKQIPPPIVERGTLVEEPNNDLWESPIMGAGDIYIKSPNILGYNGRVGVLAGAVNCGSVGRMIYELDNHEYTIIAPTLLLKSAPVDLTDLSETVNDHKYTRSPSTGVKYSCGMPVNLVVLPERTQVITEIEAIDLLFGLIARPIAMSGVGTGAATIGLSVEGSESWLDQFWDYICSIKGTKPILPYPLECKSCPISRHPSYHMRCGGYLK